VWHYVPARGVRLAYRPQSVGNEIIDIRLGGFCVSRVEVVQYNYSTKERNQMVDEKNTPITEPKEILKLDEKEPVKRAKQADEVFCPSCGEAIKKEAVICVKCGVSTRNQIQKDTPKDKSTSVLLAVFLGYWSWLYTYKKDAWKFWLGLSLNLTIFNPLWTWLILFIPNIAIWIWVIVDVSVKPASYYKDFPNG